jgi:MFS family permease
MALDLATASRAAGVDQLRDSLSEALGGPARARVIALLACVLGLEAADQGTIGAVATQLEGSLGITHTELGLLASVTALIAAAATLPFGVLVDRAPRTPILAASVALWSAAMIVSGAAGSYSMLLFSRLALGGVMAAAGPAIASLTGDLFPPRERARVFGYILTGELAGTAVGFLASGALSAAFGWRAAFWVLAIPGFVLAWAIVRQLKEPPRGGQGCLEEDAPGSSDGRPDPGQVDPRSAVAERADRPAPGALLREDPERMGLWRAVRYVLRVRTNLLLIVASALGYFFLSGVRTFAVVFVRAHYALSQTAATLALSALVVGAVAGVLVGGRLADRLLARGRISARIVVAALAYMVAAAIFVPGLLLPWLAASLPLYIVGTAALSAGNPPLDAARLDVIPFGLWGRAESVRTTLRTLAVGAAPLLFGVIADQLGGSIPEDTAGSVHLPASAGQGLAQTFMIMLVPLAAGGLILLRARRTYPRDVAATVVSEERTERRSSPFATPSA